MKAIVQDRYGSTAVLRLEDVDRPPVGDDDVLVRVRAAGVDPGVWHLMTGLPYLLRLGFGMRRPKVRVRGADVSGIVEAVGRNVTRLQPGEEVFGNCDGSFAEYVSARHDRFVPKPENLSFEEAAAIAGSGSSALQGLREVRPGQQVLIIGAAGGVGTFAVQLAKVQGAHVTAVCSTSKIELVRSIGADDVIDYTREDFTNGPHNYDFILDTAGNRPLSRLRRALTPRGTLVIIGGEGGGPWLGGTDRQLRATLLTPFTSQKLRALFTTFRHDDLNHLQELAKTGQLKPVIDRTYSLKEAPEAIRYLKKNHARGKVVITV